jgi:hypothetical protein
MRAFAIRTLALILLLLPVAAHAQTFSQGFETDTSGWYNQGNGTITRVPSGFSTGGGYADAINSSQGSYHARLHVDPAANFGNAGNPQCAPGSKDCIGPYTDWGLSFSAGRFPTGGVSTSADIYLDTAFAAAHKDYRFDWDSALNDSTGQFLQDYVFNVGTAAANDPCTESGAGGNSHFVVAASTNALRESSSPEDPNHNPQCISASGWYTFQHVFKPDPNGNLEVDMTITNKQTGAVAASWALHPNCEMPQSLGLCSEGQPLPVTAVGGNAYGWFANQEIDQLALDDTNLHTLQPQLIKDCKDGGWENFSDPSFKNQSQCASFVEHQGD